jgi:L-fuconolactonase
MRVDSHHHYFSPGSGDYPWMIGPEYEPLRRERGPLDLAPELEAHDIDATVLVQTWSSSDETRRFLELATTSPYVSGVVGWVDLTAEDIAERIDELRCGTGGERLVGVRHQVHDEPDPEWLLRRDVHRGLAAIEASGLVFDLLVRPRELPAAVETVRSRPNLRFVLDHAGKPDIRGQGRDRWRALVGRLAAESHVDCKISGLITECEWADWNLAEVAAYAADVLDLFGVDRCMFGSDWPVCLVAGTYSDVVSVVDYVLESANDTERDAVWGGTAVRTYGLASPAGAPP